MLAIRMQRTGRKGSAQFRMIVQDSRRTPTSGNVVELLGNYNPHTKEAHFDKDKVLFYLGNGAQPTDRVVRILSQEKVKMPNWLKKKVIKKRAVKNPQKLRRNQPQKETEVVTEEPQLATEPEDEAKTESVETEAQATDAKAEEL